MSRESQNGSDIPIEGGLADELEEATVTRKETDLDRVIDNGYMY